MEALFSLPGINRQQQNQPSLTLETWILASYSRKRPRRNACVDVNLCHRFASLRSCSHPAQSLFIFSEAAASLFPPSSSHPGSRLPGCLSEGRQQVFCDSEIREPSERRSPSELCCLCGRRRRRESLRFHFQRLSSLLQQERALIPPSGCEDAGSIPARVSYPRRTLMYVSSEPSEEPCIKEHAS